MITVEITPDKKLVYFTKKKYGEGSFSLSFSGRRSVKDLLESAGIPHVEIGRVEMLKEEVYISSGLEEHVSSTCRLKVISAEVAGSVDFSAIDDISELCFVLDVHLGRLAVNLGMLGFNVDYSNERDDRELAELVSGSRTSGPRILLSCDRGLLMRKNVGTGMLIRSRKPVEQAAEVLRRYNLTDRVKPLSVCSGCGGRLEPAGALEDLSSMEKMQLPPKVKTWCDSYSRCSGCGKLYWEGSHFAALTKKINEIISLSSA